MHPNSAISDARISANEFVSTRNSHHVEFLTVKSQNSSNELRSAPQKIALNSPAQVHGFRQAAPRESRFYFSSEIIAVFAAGSRCNSLVVGKRPVRRIGHLCRH